MLINLCMKGRLLPATPFATSNLNEVATQDTGTSVVEDDRAPSLVRGSIVDIRAAAGAAYIVIVASRAGDASLGDGECSTSGEGAEAAAEITDLTGFGTLAGFENVVRLVHAVVVGIGGTSRAQGRSTLGSRSTATGEEGIVMPIGERRSTSTGSFLYAYGLTFGEVAEETTVEVVLASAAIREERVGFLDVGRVVHRTILVDGHGERSVLVQVGNLWIE